MKNTHVNIGVGEDISIIYLAERIQDMVGFKGLAKWDDTKPDGTPRKLLDVTKIHSMGWKAKIDLIQGLKIVYGEYILCQN
jgi:GDP-L-fucose synthase